jgi:hypothetical protein
MLAWSPGTGKKDLTAGTIILPHFKDSTEFVAWLPRAKGKFVLVAPGRQTCRPAEDWRENATPESLMRIMAHRDSLLGEWRDRIAATGYSLALGTGSLGLRMEKAGVAGFVTSRPKDGWGTIEVFETYDTIAPAVGLSCEDYGLVYRLTEDGRNPQVRMNLDADLLGEQPVFNTIATIPGSSKKDEYVMLSAHFDSWDGSSGATDNGTGTLTMMEAMRILKLVYPHPKRTILVGHWSSEEEGLVGSRAFTEDHPEVVKGLQVLLNQDNGTGRIVRASGGGLPDAAAHLEKWIDLLPPVYKEQIDFGGAGLPGGGGSDHASFSCYGAPAVELGGLSWDYGNYTWHTNRDTYDKVVFDDLKSNATLFAMLAYLASESPDKISRERVDLQALAAAQEALADSARANPADSALARRAGLGRGGRFHRADDRGLELRIRFLEVHRHLRVGHAPPHRSHERDVEQAGKHEEGDDAEGDDRRDAELERFEPRGKQQQREDRAGDDHHDAAQREPLPPSVAHASNDVDELAASIHAGQLLGCRARARLEPCVLHG